MKPTIIITDVQLKKMNGGGQTVAKTLLESLGKDYDFTYLGYPMDLPIKIVSPFKNEAAAYGRPSSSRMLEREFIKKIVRFALHRSKRLRNKLLREGEIDADLVISNSVYDDFVLLQDSNFKVNYKAAIFISHNPYFEFSGVYPNRLLKGRPFKLIALNKTAFERLSKRYGKDKVRLIYNGLDYKKEKTDKRYLSKLGIKKTTKVILSMGRLNDIQKKFSYGILAFKQISRENKDAVYLIAGGGADKPKYENLIEKLQIGDKVKLLGFVSDAQKHTLLQRADLLLSPSIKETFGIVTLEGLQNGKVVLTTKNEGSADLIDDGKNGFFIRANPGEIARKCLWALNLSASEKRRISKNAVKSSRNFTVKNMVSGYKQVIDELLRKVYK